MNLEINDYNAMYYPIFQEVKTIRQLNLIELVDYNIRNTFLENSYSKCSEEISRRLFFKKSKISISLDQESEILLRFLLW